MKELRKVFKIPTEKEVHLYALYSGSIGLEQITEMCKSIQESGLYPLQKIVIEVQNEDGTWPREVDKEKE